MTKIAVLGASGQIAKLAEEFFLKDAGNELILFLRHPNKLDKSEIDENREKIIVGMQVKQMKLLRLLRASTLYMLTQLVVTLKIKLKQW